MSQTEQELRQVFEKLGIEILESTSLAGPPATRKKFSELSGEALLRWFRQLGPKSPDGLVEEIRKRGLVSDDELRLWLKADPGAP